MKKAISILLALLLATGSLAGCGRETAAETTAATTAAETTAKETTTTAEETTAAPVLTDEQILALSAYDFLGYVSQVRSGDAFEQGWEADSNQINPLIARQFLHYIKNKKLDDIAVLLGIQDEIASEVSKVFNKLDVDSYEIIPSPSPSPSIYSPYDFIVILRISKSSSTLFPVGTSRWYLGTEADGEGWVMTPPINMFRNVNDTSVGISQFLTFPSLDAVNFCHQVSAQLRCFETMDNFNKLVANAESKDNIDWFYSELVLLLLANRDGYYSENAYPAKRTELEVLAKSTFGITNIDFTKYSEYNSADDTVNGSLNIDSIDISARLSSSSYDQTSRIHTVVLEYYLQSYIFKARVMKYTLRENTDGSLTLLSTRLVFDSGYDVWWA